jgi:hypothetical protein
MAATTNSVGPTRVTAEAQRFRGRRRWGLIIAVVIAAGLVAFAVMRSRGTDDGDKQPKARTGTTSVIRFWQTDARPVLTALAADRVDILEAQTSTDPGAIVNVHLGCSRWAEDATALAATAPSGDANLDALIDRYNQLVTAAVATCLADDAGVAPAPHTPADTIKSQIAARAAPG